MMFFYTTYCAKTAVLPSPNKYQILGSPCLKVTGYPFTVNKHDQNFMQNALSKNIVQKYFYYNYML